MTAPNTTLAPVAPAAPAAAPASAGAPGASTSITPAAPVSRAAARASIMGNLEATVAANEQAAPAAPAAPVTAAAAAPAAAAVPGAPDPAAAAAAPAAQAIEIHPESGPNAELGALKLRFKGSDGQYTPTPVVSADHKIEIEVGGKTYVKDFAGIVRLAADGIANQRHASENSQLKTRVIPTLQQTTQQLQEQLEQQIALNREILGDENSYATRRQQWLALNSPEQRADRAERALEEQNRQATETAQSAQRVEFYRQNILPVLTGAIDSAPTVSNEEALGRIAMQTTHLQVNGVVPPERYPEFAAYLRDTFAPWARAEHAKRSHSATPPAPLTPTVTDAQRAAQLATRDVGSAFAPAAPSATGSSTSTTIAPGNQPPAKSRAEARERVRSMMTAGLSG